MSDPNKLPPPQSSSSNPPRKYTPAELSQLRQRIRSEITKAFNKLSFDAFTSADADTAKVTSWIKNLKFISLSVADDDKSADYLDKANQLLAHIAATSVPPPVPTTSSSSTIPPPAPLSASTSSTIDSKTSPELDDTIIDSSLLDDISPEMEATRQILNLRNGQCGFKQFSGSVTENYNTFVENYVIYATVCQWSPGKRILNLPMALSGTAFRYFETNAECKAMVTKAENEGVANAPAVTRDDFESVSPVTPLQGYCRRGEFA